MWWMSEDGRVEAPYIMQNDPRRDPDSGGKLSTDRVIKLFDLRR